MLKAEAVLGYPGRLMAVERAWLWHAPHHARGGLWQSQGVLQWRSTHYG